MKTYTKTTLILIGILLITTGFLLGSINTKTHTNIKTQSNKQLLDENIVAKDSIQSLFFTELEKDMPNYLKGSEITILPISYKFKIAVISFENSEECMGLIVIDFNSRRNKVYQTNKFTNCAGEIYYPILVVSENRFVSVHQKKGNNIELDITDLTGNLVKVLKKFVITSPIGGIDFHYRSEFDNNIISIFGKNYTIDQNLDLVLIK